MLIAIENWHESRTPPPLQAGHVHLWRAVLTPTDSLREVLSPSEWLRAERFHFDIDRERFIATRGILRRILATYLDMDPRDVLFETGAHGKPGVAGGGTLRFNLSHSSEIMLLAVTHAREIGVDIEKMKPNVPFETLADHYFDPEDAWDLRLLPASQRAWKFYDIWTTTEAKLKAEGVGLAQGIKVAEPDRWSLLKLIPATGYTAAVAVEGGDFQLQCCSWTA